MEKLYTVKTEVLDRLRHLDSKDRMDAFDIGYQAALKQVLDVIVSEENKYFSSFFHEAIIEGREIL